MLHLQICYKSVTRTTICKSGNTSDFVTCFNVTPYFQLLYTHSLYVTYTIYILLLFKIYVTSVTQRCYCKIFNQLSCVTFFLKCYKPVTPVTVFRMVASKIRIKAAGSRKIWQAVEYLHKLVEKYIAHIYRQLTKSLSLLS